MNLLEPCCVLVEDDICSFVPEFMLAFSAITKGFSAKDGVATIRESETSSAENREPTKKLEFLVDISHSIFWDCEDYSGSASRYALSARPIALTVTVHGFRVYGIRNRIE